MFSSKMGRQARLAFALAAACASMPLLAAPPAHVMARGDAADPAAAYVVLVPRVTAMDVVPESFKGVIKGRTPDGADREYAIEVPTARPTIVRVAPGRYHLDKIEIGPYFWPFEEQDSLFDARPGQLNYPGDWIITIAEHDIMRGARSIGARITADLFTTQASVDIGPLDLEPDFKASLKTSYTRAEPAARPGFGDR